MPTYSTSLDALGDPTRRSILERLARRPMAVGELAEQVPVSRPAVSQHLKVLRGAGLVIDEAMGARRIYRVDPKGLEALRSYFDDFWGAALAHVKAESERTSRRV